MVIVTLKSYLVGLPNHIWYRFTKWLPILSSGLFYDCTRLYETISNKKGVIFRYVCCTSQVLPKIHNYWFKLIYTQIIGNCFVQSDKIWFLRQQGTIEIAKTTALVGQSSLLLPLWPPIRWNIKPKVIESVLRSKIQISLKELIKRDPMWF